MSSSLLLGLTRFFSEPLAYFVGWQLQLQNLLVSYSRKEEKILCYTQYITQNKHNLPDPRAELPAHCVLLCCTRVSVKYNYIRKKRRRSTFHVGSTCTYHRVKKITSIGWINIRSLLHWTIAMKSPLVASSS